MSRATGALDQGWNVTADKPVRDMVLVGTTLYFVGDFTKVNGAGPQAGGRGEHRRLAVSISSFHPA